MREVARRDARLSAEVGDALSEASTFEGAARFEEAIQSAERARALAQSGSASGESLGDASSALTRLRDEQGTGLMGRVDATLTRLRGELERARVESERKAANEKLLAELLEAREPIWLSGTEDNEGVTSSYDVFARYGIDIDSGTPEHVASELEQRGLGSDIALLLDSLVELRRARRDEAGTVRALEIAHAVDPDPMRADLRETLAAGALDVLRGIAATGLPNQPPITIEMLGSAFIQLDQREDARAILRMGIERYPGDFSLQYRLGRLLTPPPREESIPAGDRESVKCYRAALALRPDSTIVRYYLSRQYRRLAEPARANEQIDIALKQRPDDGVFLFERGLNLINLGQTEQAIATLRPLTDRTDPQWVKAWSCCRTAQAYALRGETQEALGWYERALDANPNPQEFYTGLIEAGCTIGAVDVTQRTIRAYLARFASDPDAWNNVAWFLITAKDPKLRDLDEAIRLARRAIELKEAAGYWNTLGLALYYSGDYPGAIDALRKSASFHNEVGRVEDWLFLAMTHEKLGNSVEARVWYERAVDERRHTPGDKFAVRFRAEAGALFAK